MIFQAAEHLLCMGERAWENLKGLFIATEHWRKQGRLVLSVSLKGKNNVKTEVTIAGYEELHKTFDAAIRNLFALIRTQLDGISLSPEDFLILDAVHQLLLFSDENSTDLLITQAQSKDSNSWLDSLPLLKRAWQYYALHSSWTPLGALLAAYLGSAGSEAHHDFGILLRLMEVVALRHPTLSPIIVFEDLQLIAKFSDPKEREKGMTFLKQVLIHLQVRKSKD